MNQECQNWYDQLRRIKQLQVEYLDEYKTCESNKDFAPLKPNKDGLKEAISQLKESNPLSNLNRKQKQEWKIVRQRFFENPQRHQEILTKEGQKRDPDQVWKEISYRLKNNPQLIDSLVKMEETGGEPDAVLYDNGSNQYYFVDCSEESPSGRRGLCYDLAGQQEREELGDHPIGNAVDMAKKMGIFILTEHEYQRLQQLGEFDKKSRSWLFPHIRVRNKGVALFGKLGELGVDISEISSFSMSDITGFRGLLKV